MFASLEPRRLFSTVLWDGGPLGMGNAWNDPVNWVGDQLPTPADDVVITTAGVAFIHVTDVAAVRSVNSQVALSVNGGDNGILDVSHPSVISNLTLSGELLGAGQVLITGAFGWTDGAMRGTGTTVLGAQATATIAAGAGVTHARTLRNLGSLSFLQGSMLMATSSGQPGRIENAAGAMLEVGGVDITSPASGASIDNQGTLRKIGAGAANLHASGSGTLTLNNASVIDVVQGSLQLGGATMNTGLVDGAGSVTVQAGATLVADRVRQGSIAVAGSLNLRQNGSPGNVNIVGQLSVTGPSGKIDLNDNDLIIDYSGANPLSSVQFLINAARNGGTWDGASGITSAAAQDATAGNTTLGAMDSADYIPLNGNQFDGQTIDQTAVLVKYTYYGDTDFNGQVDFDDFIRTDGGFNSAASGWLKGDNDGSGGIDFDDYILLDLAFNTQTVPL